MSENELKVSDLTGVAEMDEKEFELAQRKAMVYAKSTLVPKQYQNNVSNCLIAMHMANKIGADILMVMQNLYIVHNQPSWSAKFMIACFNCCGRFSSIDYVMSNDNQECVAVCTELQTGKVLRGVPVSMAMAEKSGWSTKAGSKWKTLPELMLRYRAATFLIRTVAPELTMGCPMQDEMNDIKTIEGSFVPKTVDLNEAMKAIAIETGEVETPETFAEAIDSMDAEASGGDLFPSEGNYE